MKKDRRIVIFILIVIAVISNITLQITPAFADTSGEMAPISGDFEQKKSDAINWADIVNTAFGAFLGFGFSLLLEAKVTKENKKKSINNIIAELSQIYDGIECSGREKIANPGPGENSQSGPDKNRQFWSGENSQSPNWS